MAGVETITTDAQPSAAAVNLSIPPPPKRRITVRWGQLLSALGAGGCLVEAVHIENNSIGNPQPFLHAAAALLAAVVAFRALEVWERKIRSPSGAALADGAPIASPGRFSPLGPLGIIPARKAGPEHRLDFIGNALPWIPSDKGRVARSNGVDRPSGVALSRDLK